MSQSNAAKAYNLHTTGMGYLNRLRLVPVKKGKSYWCASIGALYGLVDENTGRAETSLYDLKIVAVRAIESAEQLKPVFDQGQKVFLEFKAGDTRAEVFQYQKGERKDQWGACIRGTLLQIRKAWVNGELFLDMSEVHCAKA